MRIDFPANGPVEVLPSGGSARYHPNAVDPATAERLFLTLFHEIRWQQDIVRMFGKTHVTARKFAFHGDHSVSYSYSGHARTALPWNEPLEELRKTAERLSGNVFNACLLNLYHNGSEGMGWHSDDEPEMDPTAPIASMSLGAGRKFSFRNRSDKSTCSVVLEHGSLLVMDAVSQQHWLHALPKSTRITEPRINLTFRRIR